MSHEVIKTKIVNILVALMPSYDVNYWSQQQELIGHIPEFDSMTIVNLLGEIEEQFGVELDDDDITADNFATVDSIADLINAQV